MKKIFFRGEVKDYAKFSVLILEPFALMLTSKQVSLATHASATERMILAVDDEPSILDIISIALRADGFAVLKAPNAAHAWELWRKHKERIELLLTDVCLPGGSGVDLAKALSNERPDLSVVIMTGFSSDKVDMGGHPCRISLLLQKPFTPSTLRNLIACALPKSP